MSVQQSNSSNFPHSAYTFSIDGLFSRLLEAMWISFQGKLINQTAEQLVGADTVTPNIAPASTSCLEGWNYSAWRTLQGKIMVPFLHMASGMGLGWFRDSPFWPLIHFNKEEAFIQILGLAL